ncbi:MAG TPA: hypothetical protein VJ727_07970 [Rhodanobacteraceae bacterium]|nr:hypothetical protein [Rhodanobacteraceae bacterium]
MKRLISLLTILGAAGLPLTAAAFDYGPDQQRFLAAETRAPSLPDTRGDSSSFSDTLSHPARAADDEAPVEPNPESGKRAVPHPASARRNTVPPVAPGPGTGSPQRPPSALSWQSLLPGSIQ